MRVFVVAGGHAVPWFEPADAPFYGLARLVPFRVVGLGVQAPAPGRNDGFNVPLRPPVAEAVAVIGPVRDQAEQGRVGLGFHQGPGLGTVVALAACHAQAQRTASSIRPARDRGAEAAPAAAPRGLRLWLWARARPVCPAARRINPERPDGPAGAAA